VKVIDLGQASPSLDEVIGMAKDELVVLRLPDGSVFAVSQVDEVDIEVDLLRNNPEFMALLKQFSQEKSAISLEELMRGVTDENLHVGWDTGPSMGKEI
jgi:hypothetical protein